MRETGNYEILANVSYFLPHALPPKNPNLQMTPEILELYSQALYNLAQLNGASKQIPDQKRFIKAYVMKEALLTSAIEGIATTLIDVLTYDSMSNEHTKSTELVIQYIQALQVTIHLIQKEKLPICSRVICAAHKALFSSNHGENASPGVYRKQTVKVGNLVPPMAQRIPELMSDLEKYINNDTSLPALIQAGLAHLQFETIHPFLDGNGRIGRLLIVAMMIDSKLLDDPILYISYYFKKHHAQYYQTLENVRTQGDFEGWIIYFLQAVRDSASDAYKRIEDIRALEEKMKQAIINDSQFLKHQETVLAIVTFLFSFPITTITNISDAIGKSYNTTQNLCTKLINAGIMSETIQTKNKRYKQYRFDAYLNLLEKEY